MNIARYFLRIFYSLKFGKYSYEYFQFFKDYYKDYPFVPCLKSKLLTFFKNMFITEIVQYKTSNDIQFGEIEFGTSFHDIVNSKGTPVCVTIEKINDTIIKVVRYNEKVLKTSMKVTYFFINEKFYMGEYKFPDTTYLNVSEILRTFLKKYNISFNNQVDKFYLLDQFDNLIYYHYNGIHINIQYFNKRNQELTDLVEKMVNSNETAQEESENLDSALTLKF